jgi:nucleoside-diphosphate-sugar epimerase
MKVFVTGAAGFIGGSIAAALVRAGDQVTGLVRDAGQLRELEKIGVEGVVSTLDDSASLTEQARAARDSVQLPRLFKQARKSGVVRHVGRGLNVWSNVHIDDVTDLYLLALEKTPAGMFYFVEAGEAAFRDMSAAIAKALGLGSPQDWPLEQAIEEWGYEMASYGLGSNSRVRGIHARTLLGWQPHRSAVLDWIASDMLRADR